MTIALNTLAESLEALDNSKKLYASVSQLHQALEESPIDFIVVSESCKYIADSLRTVSVRTPIGEAGVIDALGAALANHRKEIEEHPQLRIQALRVLGNLCFDHEENRKRIKEAGIVPVVASYLKELNQPDLIRTVCGLYLNSSMDYAPIQREIAECGAAQDLVNLLKPNTEDDGTISMAIKTLDNIVDDDDARQKIATPITVRTYMAMLESLCGSGEYLEDMELVQNLADTLLQLIMDDEMLQNEIYDMGSLESLLNFLETSETVETEDKEDEENLTEFRRAVSKIAVYAASTDAKMNEIYNNQHYLSKFLKMTESKSEIVHQVAVYILANLARTDQHCIELVQKHGLSKLLLKLYQSTEHATFQYAILGCLKHLCVPRENKDTIGNDDCIRIVTPMLDPSKDMLKRNQFLAIGIIKLLCTGSYENTKRVVENDDTLQSILAFLKRVDDIAAKSEATRVLNSLVKTIWVEKNNTNLRNRLVAADVIEPIAELIRTSIFAVLKNEGVMALTLIFSDNESILLLDKAISCLTAEPETSTATVSSNVTEDSDKQDSRSLIQVLIDDICATNDDLAVQIKCNMCLLLCKVVEAAKLLRNEKLLTAVRSIAGERLEQIPQTSELYRYSNTLSKTLCQ